MNFPEIENKNPIYWIEDDTNILATTEAYNQIYESMPKNPKSKYIEVPNRHGGVG